MRFRGNALCAWGFVLLGFSFVIAVENTDAGMIDTRRLWTPGQTLHVLFLDGEPAAHDFVEDEAREWEKYANISFEFYSDRTVRKKFDIKISFKGCVNYSHIGTNAKTVKGLFSTMNLPAIQGNKSDENKARIVKHEFGHALGLKHEHQNPNFPYTVNEEVRCSRERISERLKGANASCQTKAFRLLPHNMKIDNREKACKRNTLPIDTTGLEYGPFDEKSVMFYGFTAGHLREIDHVMVTPMLISETDAQFVEEYYPFD